MTLVDVAAAFLVGTLSGMGIGGGGLLIIYMTLFRGIDQVAAQGINLYFFIFASCAALFVHATKRNINYSHVLLLALFGMPTALAGSYAASVTDPNTIKTVFGAMLIAAGATSLAKMTLSQKKK